MIAVAAARGMHAASADSIPQVVPGRRVFDSSKGRWMVKVYPGECQFTSRPTDVLVTVLGSCVAACIRDPASGVGGMNHFMLPEDHTGGWNGDMMSTRFGNHAMEKLINELIKRGCPRERMEIKVFGGGNVIKSQQAVGTKNAEFVLRYLRDESLVCKVQDLGGDYPRRIQYSPSTGVVERKLLNRSDADPIASEESAYATTLVRTKKTTGTVELFGDFS